MDSTHTLAKTLIACPSVTPNDAGTQEILLTRLEKAGFQTEKMPFGEVHNFWARIGTQSPLLVFIGHTDVVPPGPLEAWHTPPFEPHIREGYLYGRGAQDMKGSLAAMLVACENFLAKHAQPKGSIAWLITSDEEGLSIDGTAKVAEVLKQRGEKIDYCLVGEPSSEKKLGDILKIGRRGSLSGNLSIHGKQGHIAYPQIASNPIHLATHFLHLITTTVWDQGNDFFQPTSFQISNLHAGTGAGNVIPGDLHIQFNFRYSPETTAEKLKTQVEKLCIAQKLNYSLTWQDSAQPFLTKPGKLVEACQKVIENCTGLVPTLSTHGGTSDGRFIAPLGAEIVELGPRNDTIHQINERVCLEELTQLTQIYEGILEKLLG